MTLDYVSRGIKRPWVAVERPWLGRSILEFCDNMPKSRLYAQLWKFSSDFSPEEAHQTISRCDFILFNDTYSIDLQEISRRHGLSLVMRREIGRAACRERVCTYVWISGVAVS